MESTQKPFRLLDLPREIRDGIYEELLCGVYTPIDPVRNMLRVQSRAVKVPEKVHQAMRSVETAILRTCKQIHREAYDIMIKANQFVQVETVDVPFEAFLLASQVPVVMMDREHASKFKGHMMHLFVACAIPTWADSWQTPYGPYDRNTEELEDRRFTFLVRGRDWPAFCQMLNYTDAFERQSRTLLNITLTVAPYEDTRSECKASISREFYFAAQDALLKTFRTLLRGFQNVNTQGVVSGAEEILQDVKKIRWTNPQHVVTDLLGIKELAQEYHAEDRHLEAIETYMRAVSSIQRIRFSTEWRDLASDGGELFLEELRDISTSALYSKVRWVYEYERLNPHAPLPKHIYTAIGLMTPILQFDYFDAMQWPKSLVANLSEPTKPEKNQKAVSYCRQATSWRKMDDPRTMELALHSIYVATEYAPSVNEFQEEKGRILEWIRTKFRMYLEPQ